MKNLTPAQQYKLISIAREAIEDGSRDLVVTPWVQALPPWRWIAPQPLVRSLLVSVLCLLVAVGVEGSLSVRTIVRYVPIFVDVFLGLYGAFFFARQFESIYRTLVRISLLPREPLARWFSENVSSLWGSVNLLRPEERERYGIRDLLRNDKTIVAWFVFWTLVNSFFAMIATRMLPAELSIHGATQLAVAFVWAYSFMWTAHFVPYSLGFIRRLAKLPVHYFFGMPAWMSLKSIGDVFVRLAWFAGFHFWFLIGILSVWKSIVPRPEEPLVVVAFVTYATLGIMVLYLAWQVMWVIGTQLVLCYAMVTYKRKRVAEFAFHSEKAFEAFLREPRDAAFADLENRLKQADRLLANLPTFSLGQGMLASFVFLVILDVAAVWLWVRLSGQSIAYLLDLGRALWALS